MKKITTDKYSIKPRELDGKNIYATADLSYGYIHSHIPTIGDSLVKASIASNNTGEWAHHATIYNLDDNPTHHVMYRLASAADLGRENDGSFHHYRVQPSPQNLLRPRVEDTSNNLVTDYLWTNM